jgi:hypothetical protein
VEGKEGACPQPKQRRKREKEKREGKRGGGVPLRVCSKEKKEREGRGQWKERGAMKRGLHVTKILESVCHCVWEGEGKKKRVVRW